MVRRYDYGAATAGLSWPQRDYQEIRGAGINLIDHRSWLISSTDPKPGSSVPTQLRPGRHGVKRPGGPAATPGAPPNRKTFSRRPQAIGRLQRLEDIGSAHSLPDGHADETSDPDDRHAIGRTKIAIQDRLPEIPRPTGYSPGSSNWELR